MTAQPFLAGTLALLAFSAAVPVLSAAVPPAKSEASSASMAADQRLRQPVTLAWSDRPFGEALTELGKTLRVPLTADRSVVDDPVTFFGRERPASELLPLLASHFGFQWRRKDGGYQLWQDQSAQQREAGLRQAEVQNLLRRLNAHLTRVAAVAGLDETGREARRQALLAELEAGKRSPEEREEIGAQILALDSAKDPLWRPGSAILRSITPLQLQTLASGGEITLSTQDGSLPAPVAQQVRTILLHGTEDGPVMDRGTRATLRVSDDLGFLMTNPAERLPHFFRPALRCTVYFTSNYTMNGNGDFARSSPWIALEDRPVLVEPSAPPPQDALLLQSVELVSKPLRQELRLSTFLQRLHEKTGLPILADSFIRARISDEQLAGRKPLYQLLQRLATEMDYQWELREGTLFLRSVLFYRDRPREIPLRLRRPWRERLAKNGVLSLNDLGEVATTLTDEQLRSLASYWYWQFEPDAPAPMANPAADGEKDLATKPLVALPRPPEDFVLRRLDLRLWRSLNAAQQVRARNGILPMQSLNAIQQRLALAAFLMPEREPGAQLPPTPPTPEQFALAGLSLTVQPFRAYRYSVRSADGTNTRSGSQYLPPNEPIPAPPEVEEGGKLLRTVHQRDQLNFRYFLPVSTQPATEKPLNLNHAAQPLR